jgi:CheY-like chemotaxis protein
MTPDLAPILAVEDEESDAIILRLAFQKAQILRRLVVVRDGQEAVDYLRGTGVYADRALHPLPALIVLDLKLPRMNGFDVLAWLAEQSNLKEIPTVVLSSSSDPSDIEKARLLGAREYFVKPHSFEDLKSVVQQVQARWLNV